MRYPLMSCLDSFIGSRTTRQDLVEFKKPFHPSLRWYFSPFELQHIQSRRPALQTLQARQGQLRDEIRYKTSPLGVCKPDSNGDPREEISHFNENSQE